MKFSLITIFSLIIYSSLICQEVPDSIKYKDVGPDDFLTLMRFREGALLVDVRMKGEFRKEHLENAVNIPVSKTEKRYHSYTTAGSAVLVYCTSGVRSRWAALKYYGLGFREIYSLEGGIEAWKRKGLPVEKGGKTKGR